MRQNFIQDLKAITTTSLRKDFVAGLTVLIILVPQGMAYSLIAGLPPIYGLYAALFPLFVYPWLSTSKYISIGPVALMSIIILGGISQLAEPGSPQYLKLVLMTAFLSGIIQVLLGILRVGQLTEYLSLAVMKGFISAAGIIILISQIKYLTNVELPRRTSIIDMVRDNLSHLSETNWITLILGLGTIATIVILKRIHNAIPSALITVIVGSCAVYFMNLQERDVSIIGHVPQGLPTFDISFWDSAVIFQLIPISIIVALVGFVGSFSISKSIGTPDDIKRINANKELVSLGFAKIVGSFFLAMPSTGSFTRSAINNESDAQSQISSLFTALFLILVLLFLSPAFYYLPEAVLAGIVIASVFSLIDYNYAKGLYTSQFGNFTVFLITMISTLLLGITNGIIIGIIASIVAKVLQKKK